MGKSLVGLLLVGVCLLGLFAACSEAHLCLLFPPQRGPLGNINQPGSLTCFHLVGPCGSAAASSPTIALRSGASYNITFQKNINHFNSAQPGSFVVSYSATAQSPSFQKLAVVPDTNAPALTLYSAGIALPRQSTSHGLLQVQYITNNGVGPFYQCSDISVL
jgi:hypothetical protein